MLEGMSLSDENNRRRSVYVVYGQNTDEKKKIVAILQTFELQPLTKKEIVGLAAGSSFIGDVLNIAFERTQAVIVLLTGNEEVRLREKFQRSDDEDFEKDFCLQPTQDQIFEAGYAFGKSPERTILVGVGEVRPFSDIAGRYILNYAETLENTDLLRACLLRAGCIINGSQALSLSLPRYDMMEVIDSHSDPKGVFVVHGRNIGIMKELFAFLRILNLLPTRWYEAIRLTEGGASYVGEIVEAGIEDAKAVLVLLTGDDEVKQKKFGKGNNEQLLYSQARPNVLFEAGMAFSRYKDRRTILVQIGKVRSCPAMHGRTTVRLNDKPGPRWDLMQRLHIVGCEVDFSGKWDTTGNFTIANDS